MNGTGKTHLKYFFLYPRYIRHAPYTMHIAPNILSISSGGKDLLKAISNLSRKKKKTPNRKMKIPIPASMMALMVETCFLFLFSYSSNIGIASFFNPEKLSPA